MRKRRHAHSETHWRCAGEAHHAVFFRGSRPRGIFAVESVHPPDAREGPLTWSFPATQKCGRKVLAYVSGEISLDELDEWLAPILWEMHEKQSPIDLLREIELRMAEYSGGGWSEDELRDLLREAVYTFQVRGDKTRKLASV